MLGREKWAFWSESTEKASLRQGRQSICILHKVNEAMLGAPGSMGSWQATREQVTLLPTGQASVAVEGEIALSEAIGNEEWERRSAWM